MGYTVLQSPDGSVAVIYVIDERADGTVVVLRCSPDGNGGGGGITIPSGHPGEAGYTYPFGREEAEIVAMRVDAHDVREVVIDTTGLVARRPTFNLAQFIDRAQHASDEPER